MNTRALWRFLLYSAALVSSARGADPLDGWQWLNPLPTGNTLSDVTFASGLFVAVGPSGSIMTSPTGDQWTSRVSGTTNGLVGIGQGNGVIIAVGERGTILISSNAINWAARASGVSTRLNQVVHGGGQFMVVGHGGTVLTSPDGLSWTQRTSGSTGSLTDIAYGNGLYVVVVGDSDSRTILRSSDGVSWESQNVSATVAGGGYSAENVAYGAGRFVLSGTRRFFNPSPSSTSGLIVTSTDGSNWTHSASLPTSAFRYVVRFLNEHFVAPGKSSFGTTNRVGVSTDGLVWTNYLTSVTNNSFPNDIAYGAGRYLIAVAGVPAFEYSSNLLSWVPNRYSPTSKNVSIAAGNGRRVAVGEMAARGYANDTFLNNGTVKMMAQTIGSEFTNVPVTSAALSRVYYASNAFYAMGNNGTLLRSTDGINWSNRNSSTFERLWSMTYGDGKLIAVGEFGGSIWSLNGNQWSYLQTGTQYPLYSICHGSAGFVAVGYAGTIRTSPDGINWTPQDSQTSRSLFGVTATESGYVAVGESGTVVTSIDGANWILQPPPTIHHLYSIAFGNGVYVMTGVNNTDDSATEGVVLTSSTAQSWNQRNVGTTLPLYAVHFTGNTFLLAGANGAVLESGPVGGAQMQVAGQFVPAGFQVNLLGMPNQPCRVQAVADPVAGQWADIGIVPAGAGPMHFIDTNAALWPRRFYRAVSP